MRVIPIALSLSLFAGCVTADDAATGESESTVTVDPSVIPPDGQCTHIVATRLSDFSSVEYQGPLSGASFTAALGDHHVTATAYPEPCEDEPAAPPWRAGDQIATFHAGDNRLALDFEADVSVGIDPTFGDELPIVPRDGSLIRVGRNGEDAAGPDLALDGWDVKRIALAPAAPSETTLFSLEGKGGANALPYSPRGLARLPDGRLVAQVGEVDQPLRVFDPAGNFVAAWPTSYPAGAIHWDFSDGLDAIDADHLVRTGWLNTAQGDVQTGLEILHVVGGTAVVERQIPLPGLDYIVGVTAIGGGFAITTLPEGGTDLYVLDATGAVVAGPTAIAGDVEGPFDAGDGRIGALAYDGRLDMLDAATAALRPGEERTYVDGVGLANPSRLAWDSLADAYLALADHRLVFASPGFDTIHDASIDLSSYALPVGIDYLPGADQLLVIDRLPPIDATTGTRVPAVDLYDLATSTRARSVLLAGVPLPARPRALAVLPSHDLVATVHTRPGNVPDASLDAVVFVNDLATGALAYRFDLASLGFVRVLGVNYVAASDELLITVVDLSGAVRLVVTDTAGRPRRSYRTDALSGMTDLAEITSGPDAGDLGVITGQPSTFVRIAPL